MKQITHYIQVYTGRFAKDKDVKQLFCANHAEECNNQMLRRGEYWDQIYKLDEPIEGECSWCEMNRIMSKKKGL